MSAYYEEPSTPDIDELQQLEEDPTPSVMVRVEEVLSPVQVHRLPARDVVMRNAVVSGTVQQLVGRDLRRSKITIWATAGTASAGVYIGTRLDEVEQGTCAILPALIDTFADGPTPLLEMNHCESIWVKRSGDNDVTVSFVAEYWAD